MREGINGCLWVWAKPTDYILTDGLLDALPTLYQQDEIIFQYNQGKQDWSKKSCTLFSPIGAISDLYNIQIWLDTIKVWDKDSYSNGRKEWEWWFVSMGVDHICKKYNNSDLAKKYGKVAYYSIDIKDDELVQKILEKRYTICGWFRWNSKYTNDKNKDGVLNGTDFWTSTYWHAINIIRWEKYPTRVKDNYYWSNRYNIYSIEHNLSEISCFYDTWYVITKVAEDNLEELKRLNEMNTVVVTLIAKNSELWHLTNDENLRNELHKQNNLLRSKQKDIEYEIKKHM